MKKATAEVVSSFLSTLHAETGSERAWQDQLLGIPVFDCGRFVHQDGRLRHIEERWPELFHRLAPSELYVWPKFALLHAREEGAAVVARVVFVGKKRFTFFPWQARFERERRVRFEAGPLSASYEKIDQEFMGYIPDLFLAGLDAVRVRFPTVIHDATAWARLGGVFRSADEAAS